VLSILMWKMTAQWLVGRACSARFSRACFRSVSLEKGWRATPS
jgi:hypothetical protein